MNKPLQENVHNSLSDLVDATRDLTYQRQVVKNWADRAAAAKSAMESHLRAQAEAEHLLNDFESRVRRIAGNLEKK